MGNKSKWIQWHYKRIQNFVPVRFVSEALGATVKWNANIRTVYIDMNGDVAPSPEPTGEQ